jgi:hypothetical protein
LDKLCALARAVAILIAIVAAFVAIPQAAAILLVLGGIAAICNTPEDNLRIYIVTIVLLGYSQALDVIPVVGTPLAEIFGNVGTATLGYSVVAIAIRIVLRIKNDWT